MGLIFSSERVKKHVTPDHVFINNPSASTGVSCIADSVDGNHVNSCPRPSEDISGGLSKFIVSDSVSEAELLWSSFSTISHLSSRHSALAVELFPKMFPDSPIAAKMQLGKDKLKYSVTYGLGPHFANRVAEEAKNSIFYALSIDESLNDVSQKQQMDVIINCWHDETNMVTTRYLTSTFLNRCTASDLKEAVLNVLRESNLSLDNLIQVATDGPNVNLKLLFDIKTHMKTELSSGRQILDIGTCSLHIMNNAYKAGLKKVHWNIDKFLTSIYQVFKNQPARRGHFISVTGSNNFAHKFSAIRWTENVKVIEKSLEMMPHLEKFLKESESQTDSYHFNIMKEALLDKLLPAKLHFSKVVAQDLEGFLNNFQKNQPLLPFLYGEIFLVMKNLAARILKTSSLKDFSTGSRFKKLGLDCDTHAGKHLKLECPEILKKVDDVDVGFGANFALKKVKEVDVQLFKLDCRHFILQIIKKLLEKSPINKRVVLGASCLTPDVIISEVLRTSRSKIAIEELINHNQMSASEGDIVSREYEQFCEKVISKFSEKLITFRWKNDRLDNLLMSLLEELNTTDKEENKSLVKFFKIFLVCFHGNAAVERSFSYNKDFLVENLKEKSLVAQRSLHDHISNLGSKGLLNLNVTKKLIQDHRNSSSKRKDDLKRKREEDCKADESRKRAFDEKKLLLAKMQKLEEEKTLIEKELNSVSKILNKS